MTSKIGGLEDRIVTTINHTAQINITPEMQVLIGGVLRGEQSFDLKNIKSIEDNIRYLNAEPHGYLVANPMEFNKAFRYLGISPDDLNKMVQNGDYSMHKNMIEISHMMNIANYFCQHKSQYFIQTIEEEEVPTFHRLEENYVNVPNPITSIPTDAVPCTYQFYAFKYAKKKDSFPSSIELKYTKKFNIVNPDKDFLFIVQDEIISKMTADSQTQHIIGLVRLTFQNRMPSIICIV